MNIMKLPATDRYPVAIFNNEDTREEQERRIVAVCQHYSITQEQLNYPDAAGGKSMVLLNGRDNALLKIAKRDSSGKLRANSADLLVEYLLRHGIRLLIVDPLSMTHEGSENSNEDMLIVGGIFAMIADRANCAIILVHHTRKLDQANSEGHSGNLDSARGASSLGGVARLAFTLNVMSKQDASRYGVAERDKIKHILLEQAKSNMSAPGENRIFYERLGEILGADLGDPDGESVGFLRPINFEDKLVSNTNPAIVTMIQDIEALVEEGPMTIPDIARALITSFPLHMDKKQRSLETSIRRLFSENVLTGFKGVLVAEERRGLTDAKATRYIRLDPSETTRTLDSVI
jgi:hypothetical protein